MYLYCSLHCYCSSVDLSLLELLYTFFARLPSSCIYILGRYRIDTGVFLALRPEYASYRPLFGLPSVVGSPKHCYSYYPPCVLDHEHGPDVAHKVLTLTTSASCLPIQHQESQMRITSELLVYYLGRLRRVLGARQRKSVITYYVYNFIFVCIYLFHLSLIPRRAIS